jgi:hypothetical protein
MSPWCKPLVACYITCICSFLSDIRWCERTVVWILSQRSHSLVAKAAWISSMAAWLMSQCRYAPGSSGDTGEGAWSVMAGQECFWVEFWTNLHVGEFKGREIWENIASLRLVWLGTTGLQREWMSQRQRNRKKQADHEGPCEDHTKRHQESGAGRPDLQELSNPGDWHICWPSKQDKLHFGHVGSYG